ncbi:MAG: type II toxin-antitoxin system PemK/MazF family toxin [Anaerolineae bacterium]|nr:type II toxin-antitoxin system PemK/MazF family toxin [Anaerolineae bacterium]
MRRGEVRWYTFPNPDKRRPVLILTRDSAIPYLNELTVAPIMSNIWGVASEIVLGLEDGMRHECAANFDHLSTVPKHKLGNVITVLSAERMAEVGPAIAFALGFEGDLKV